VRIASRSTTAGVVRADTTEEMRVVSDFLRRQFAQLPYMTIGEGKDERLAFAADQKNLRFVAPAPLYSRGAGLMIYTLAAKRTDDGREVRAVRSRQRALRGDSLDRTDDPHDGLRDH
jgi:hypothetical protein